MRSCAFSMRHKLVAVLGMVAVMVLAGGCVTTPPHRADFPAPPEPVVTLQAGDNLNFEFLYWPDLNATQMVRPDGKISLQMIGDVEVKNLTPDQVKTKLEELYADKLKNPSINVTVKSYDSQRVYVGGEVRTPGAMPFLEGMTALDALMMAGGPLKQSARLRTVVVVRNWEGKQVAQRINLKRSLKKAETEPFFLEPCDVIFVPRITIDRVDQWVDQYINQVIPRNTTANMTFFKDVGPGQPGVNNFQGTGF